MHAHLQHIVDKCAKELLQLIVEIETDKFGAD